MLWRLTFWLTTSVRLLVILPKPTIFFNVVFLPTAASGWLRLPDLIKDSSCGLPVLFANTKLADRAPPAVGANCTFTWQVAPAATEPHVFATTVKSPVFAPVTVTLLMTKRAVPQFVM